MAKRINPDEIDESLVIAAVKKDRSSVPDNPGRLLQPSTVQPGEDPAMTAGETTQGASAPGQPKEEGRRKRKPQDYEGLFIRGSDITARLGKTVYIRREFHDRILKIVQVIGGNEVSLSGYIDNVLAHHFESFREDITQAYRQRISNDIF